ncbi:MAG: hypothetical protein BWY27_00710 [Bacteroidetes bacterium ADurb.Bin234]|nr:MAG: hypothetical protein BWY27_00710 [Bacteroidetes bacterium ADurb.Bin234]
MKIYQVSRNLYTLKVREINIIKKTDSFYWTSNSNRCALNTNYHMSFETEFEAKRYIKSIIESNIERTKRTLNDYEKVLKEFEDMYGDV